MNSHNGDRGRVYTEVAQKFANSVRNDLVYRQRTHYRKNLNMVTLIKSFDLLDKSPTCTKKVLEPHRLYTTKHFNKEKKQIVQSFKQKLKHNLEESRMKKQERNQHLGNMVRRQRSCMQTSKLNKKEEMLDRKKKQATAIKNNLGKFRQSLNQNMFSNVFKEESRKFPPNRSPPNEQPQGHTKQTLHDFNLAIFNIWNSINTHRFINIQASTFDIILIKKAQKNMQEQRQDVSADVRRHFRIYTTLIEIVEERGYYVPDNKKFDQARQFQINMSNVERQVFYMDSEEEGKQKNALGLHCNFSRDKIEEHFVNKFLNLYSNAGFESIIFVTGTKEKSGADTDKQVQMKIAHQASVRIEIFKQQDLLFNVLKHDLVPTHKILKQQESKQLLEYYKIKQSQLPKILLSDPVARFLGLKRGQIVKIIRKSQTAGLYTSYRVAV